MKTYRIYLTTFFSLAILLGVVNSTYANGVVCGKYGYDGANSSGYCKASGCGNIGQNGGSDYGPLQCYSKGGGVGTCSTGSASSVSSGQWTCSLGGFNVSCGTYTPPPPPPSPVAGVCGSLSGTNQVIPTKPQWCKAGTKLVSQTGDKSNSNIWKWDCLGVNGGTSVKTCSFTQQCPQGQYVSNGVCVPSPASCGSAGSGLSVIGPAPTPLTSTPTTNLCSVGSASTVSIGPSTYDWTCTNATTFAISSNTIGLNSNSVKCSAPRVVGSNALTGNGGGGPIVGPSNNNTCVLITNNASITPSLVATPSSKCTLNWNPSDSSGICSLQSKISCTLDGNPTSSSNTSPTKNINVGTHTLVCTDTSTTATSTVKCKLSPSYGEF